MNMNTSLVRVDPITIGENLRNVEGQLRNIDALTEDDIKLMRRMLVTAANNINMLFELRADPESGEFRLENYGQAWMLADLLRAGQMVPSGYDKDEQVVIALMKSMEIGVSPITGLANIMIVNNRPSVWGDLAQALVQRSGALERIETEELGERPDSSVSLEKWPEDYGYRVTIWRKGQEQPYVGEYRVRDARRARLWGNPKKQPWITDPARMLFNRARAFPIRDGFADKLFGMGIIEEQRDFEVEQARLEPGSPALIGSLTDDEPETEPVARDYSEAKEPEEERAEEYEQPPEVNDTAGSQQDATGEEKPLL